MASDDQQSGQESGRKESPEEDYGYYFYPERGGKVEKSPWNFFSYDRGFNAHLKCIRNVHSSIESNPMVKLLMGALKSKGCPVEVGRHISCEPCTSRVNGGFDPSTRQVVICENNSTNERLCGSVLTHELIHMFDYCRANVDFTNLEHLACSEIRAANMHCSFATAVLEGDASLFKIKERHKECAKRKALMSVLMVRNISMEEGQTVVNKVFEKCYNDTEPFGRIPRRNSRDPHRVYAEGYAFGYTDNLG